MTSTANKMTPQERVACTMNGEKPDKLPIVVINSNTFMCMYYGLSVEEYVSDPVKCADANIKFIKEFEVDCDLFPTGYILYGCGPELGVKWKFVGDQFPGFIDVPINTEADLESFMIPTEPSGYFKTYLETIKLVNDALGDNYHLTASILGPFTTACFLHGIEATLLDTIMKPDFFHKLMERCTEISTFFGKSILDTGLKTPILNEIFLSPGTIRPETYHNMIAQYDHKVQQILGPEKTPNSFAFMGKPNNIESQKISTSLYGAFFGVGESLSAIKMAAQEDRSPGFPFPASISGRALDTWDIKSILNFLKPALDFLVKEKGIYPSVSLSSVQAHTPEKAHDLAEKIKIIKAFRDDYLL